MSACGTQFVNKIYWLFYMIQLIANAKTVVVVNKSPTAAVAVNSDKFILRTFLKILITFIV